MAFACSATSGEQSVVGWLDLISAAHLFMSWVYCSTEGGLKSIPITVASAANPNGLDVVYWIAPENGAKKSATPHVFHICQGVSPLRGKAVNSGSVTQAYSENATRITKQIPMEQKQCGFASAADNAASAPTG